MDEGNPQEEDGSRGVVNVRAHISRRLTIFTIHYTFWNLCALAQDWDCAVLKRAGCGRPRNQK